MAVRIHVDGVVQGVGFRPFVYRIAKKNGLRGYVKNLGDAGVEIHVEGEENAIREFLLELRTRAPPLARVEGIRITPVGDENHDDFTIAESSSGSGGGDSIIPPDVAICDDCLRELFDPGDRRYMYPFIVCTNCGPRFSIIESLPYDRENTSMREFPMCESCRVEYEDPMNRRYHAEPVCCEECGPRYELITREGIAVDGDPIEEAAKLIDDGYIVAIKGIGGFHIACDASNGDVVRELRKRIRRRTQPFAIMARDIDTIKEFAVLRNESDELTSYRRPIVLLPKRNSFPLPEEIAPGLHTVGVMLPYAGVHHLLFHYSRSRVYVMTSANYPDFPMVKDNDRIGEIKDAVDYFLIHNRRIVNRVDDSVVRFVDGKRAVIRRSRGFVPLPVSMPFSYRGLAMGAELMNSFSVVKGNRIYPSQYIGNTHKVEVLDFMRESISFFRKLLSLDSLDLVVVDSHPLYNTSKIGKEMHSEVLNVQHHYAHIASVMAEKNLGEAVGIAVDAVGYGLDGKTWGGEIIAITDSRIRRLNHISYFPLPGGDLASYYPLRSLAGLLSMTFSPEDVDSIIREHCSTGVSMLKHGERELEMIIRQLERGINLGYASSTGRVLDAVAALLGVEYRRTYEGEPAMKLESIAMSGRRDLGFRIPIERGIEIHELFPQILEAIRRGERRSDIAYSAHLAIARAMAGEAVAQAENLGIRNVVISGGVAYNEIIVREVRKIVEDAGLNFLAGEEVPRGDNGISVGQAYLGGMYLEGMIRRSDVGVIP